MTHYPSNVIGWHCNICETTVDIWETVDHIASLQHRSRAVRHPLGNLADELTGHYIRGTPAVHDGGGGEVEATKEKQPTVDSEEDSNEEAEEEEEVEEEEEEEDEKWDDDGESEGIVVGDRMLWTCEICATTINVFARDDHLRSRPHLRQSRSQSHKPTAPSTESPIPPSWRCAVCDEEMTVFHQAAHLAGKPHLKMVRNQRLDNNTRPATPHTPDHPYHYDYPPEQYPISPESARSTSYQFRETFYCITCAAEFDRSTQELHLDSSDTWDCTLCSTTMHPAAREGHLQSEIHVTATARSQPVDDYFYCTVCQRVCELVRRAEHLAGTAHQTMAARNGLEQQYHVGQNAVQSSLNPLAQTWDHTTANQQTPNWAQAQQLPYPVYCYICNQVLFGELLSNHLLWHFTNAPTSTAPASVPAAAHTTSWGNVQGNNSNLEAPMYRQTAPPQQKHTKKKKATQAQGSLYCDVCKKYKKATEMPSHKQSKKHKKKAAKIEQAKVPSPNAAQPPPVPQVQVANLAVSSAPYITISGNTFHCKVCVRDRMVMGMEGHVKSKAHKKNVAAALAQHPAPVSAPGYVASQEA